MAVISVIEVVNQFTPFFALNHADIAVIQFGSSQNKKFVEEGIDIDILLLSGNDWYNGQFNRLLTNLKKQMVDGEFLEGYTIEGNQIVSAIEERRQYFLVRGIAVHLKFVFGPMLKQPQIAGKINVYLHIKGPLTLSQFSSFSQLFPFHARSIAANHSVITGEFRLPKLKSTYHNFGDFDVFATSLISRAKKELDPWCAIKCIKKLAQNYYLLWGDAPGEIHLWELLKNDFGICNLGEESSLNQVKAIIALYEQMSKVILVKSREIMLMEY